MFSFFMIIAFIILISWVVVRLIILRFVKRAKNTDYPQAGNDSRRKDGEVYVSRDETDDDKKVVEKDMGEYVDYETIKEDKDENI